MGFGSPIAVMLLFSLLALCAVLFAIPALRSPPPGVPYKRCTDCKHSNNYAAERCKKCDGPLELVDNNTDQDPHDDGEAS